MPLPANHIRSLKPHLRIHLEEVEELHVSLDAITCEINRLREMERSESPDPYAKKYSIPALQAQHKEIEREIKIHEALIALGRDERILNTLGEVIDNLDLAREAARDPKAFAKDRGIEIPANMKLELDVNRDWISLRVTYYDQLVPFVLTWDHDGFSPPRPARRQDAEPVAEPPAACET